MKKIPKLILSCMLFLCTLCLIPGTNHVQAAQTVTPTVLKSGSEQDLVNAEKKSTYHLESDGTEIFRLDVPKSGAIEWKLVALKPGQVNLCIHKKADASDLPTYAAFICTVDNGNTFTLRQYIKKGTYYLKFPKGQNSYELSMILYSSEGGKITNGSTVAAYCDAGIHRSDSSIPYISNSYSYKAAKTGYLTISKRNLVNISASMSISFYDTKGKKITDFTSDHDITGKIAFPVKKGASYKIHVGVLKDGQQFYQMKFDFTPLTEKSGASKTKAQEIKLKAETKGMIYAEESVKTQDWYKFRVTKTQKLKLTCHGGVISGSMDVIVYNSKMKRLGTYNLMPMSDESSTYTLKNEKKGTKLAKGTYYIKIVKERKQTAGYYEFKVHP